MHRNLVLLAPITMIVQYIYDIWTIFEQRLHRICTIFLQCFLRNIRCYEDSLDVPTYPPDYVIHAQPHLSPVFQDMR